MDEIAKYFPELSPEMLERFRKMSELYKEWNEKINVVSRKDIDNIYINHILHSLSIAKFINFQDGTTVIDLGTGGGFPAIPLALLFPNVHFHLVDRVGKKLKVAEAVAEECGIKNVSFQHGDFSECKLKADFVVSRAVMPQKDLVKLVRKNISPENKNAIPNGLITLKGGDLNEELKRAGRETETVDISTWFDEDFFKTKKLIYSPF